MGVVAPKDALKPIEWIALKIASKHADNFRDECPVGNKQAVDILVRVVGTVDVAPDRNTTKNIVNGPDAETVLAHVMKRLTVEDSQRIRDAVLSAYAADANMPIEEGHLEAAKIFVGSMQRTTKTTGTAKGSTKGIFQVGSVELAQISNAVTETITKATRMYQFDGEPDAQEAASTTKG